MRCVHRLAVAGLMAIGIAGPGTSCAQPAWPSQPISLVIPFPPGGNSDVAGRVAADWLGRALGGTVVVVNRPGATTQIGTEAVARAVPDGHTWLLSSDTSFTVLPHLRKVGYTLDDFEGIGNFCEYIAVMAVKPALPVANMTEFIQYARSQPGRLSYGSAGEASVGHIMGGALAVGRALSFQHVPYKGSAAAVTATVGGEVDFVIDGSATAMIRAGRLKPIAVFFRERHPELPNVPTLKEVGVDINYGGGAGKGILVPKATPRPIVDRIVRALAEAVKKTEFQEAVLKGNYSVAYQPPEIFMARLRADARSNVALLPAIGIRPQ